MQTRARACRAAIVATLAALVLTVTACGASGGSPSTSSSPANSPVAGTTAPSAPASGNGVSSTAAPSTAASNAGTESATAGSSGVAASVTLGVGGLDAASLNWANTMCSGLAPVTALSAMMLTINMSDPKASQKAVADGLDHVGDAFVSTAKTLQGTPPPGVDNGQQVAADAIGRLTKQGPAIKQVAATLAAAPVTDASSLQSALAVALASVSQQLSALDLSSYHLAPEAEKQITALPACQALSVAAGQAGVGGGTSPTSGG